jgi:membrane-bound metal-dependent hydrolase YbcI (DUF457 family)
MITASGMVHSYRRAGAPSTAAGRIVIEGPISGEEASMFIGHFAVGFGAKRLAPRASLGTLLLAPLFLDALWPVFLATGLESVRIDPGNTAATPLDLHDYPYSHSLAAAVFWSIVFAVIYRIFRGDRRASFVLGAAVFSHWVLDFVTHRPDMPLYPGSATLLGLGLWNSLPGTVIVESAMFAAGVYLYATGTRARDRAGTVAFVALVALLGLIYPAAIFGPPPPSVRAVIIGAFVAWIFFPWAVYADRHRTPATIESEESVAA